MRRIIISLAAALSMVLIGVLAIVHGQSVTSAPSAIMMVSSNGGSPYSPLASAMGTGLSVNSAPFIIPMCSANGNAPYTPCAIPQQLCHFTTATSISTGTAQVVLQSCTIAANTLGNNARLAIHATFIGGAANTGNCVVGVKFDIVNTISATNVIFDTATAATVTATFNANITERNANNAQIVDSWGARNSTFVSTSPSQTSTFSTTVPLYVVFVGQPGVSNDVCTLNEADVVLWPF